MILDAEFTVKIKMENLVFPNNISAFELKSKLLQEGDKRMKYLASGFLVDPEGRAVSQEVTYKIKED
jgi:hypothetical protein